MSKECVQQACSFSPFCLGMCEWTDCPGKGRVNITPHPQAAAKDRPSTSSSATRKEILPPTERFNYASEDELFQLSKGHIPANTVRSTERALKVFRMWKEARNERSPQNAVPDNLFEDGDPSQLTTHLSRFIVEVRKTNGEFYPPSTLHLLLCALLWHMRDINHGCPNYLDSRFWNLHGTLDAYFHKLRSGTLLSKSFTIETNHHSRSIHILWECVQNL